MPLLRDQDIEKLAPLVGQVVLCFSALETWLDDLEGAVIQNKSNRCKQQRKEGKQHVPVICKQINRICRALEQLGADDLSRQLSNVNEMAEDTAIRRNHVIHGHWWWNHISDTINTAKKSRKTGEMEYCEWDASSLEMLIERIKDVQDVVHNVKREVRNRRHSPLNAA